MQTIGINIYQFAHNARKKFDVKMIEIHRTNLHQI